MLTVIKTSRNRIILSALPVTRVFLSFSTGSSLGTESVVAQDNFESNHDDAKKSSNKKDNVYNELKSNLRPCDVVRELDKHIVGQSDAKRAVAIALRNRWRRKNLPAELRKEVTPRNVLMIGPTGCGKTEVARRMAELGGAPFIKVEATKFTEVGYHGRDVDQIIRDLVDISMNLTKKQQTEKLKEQVEALVLERLVDTLSGPNAGSTQSREAFKQMILDGSLDDTEIEVDVPSSEKSNAFSIDTSGGGNPDAEKKWGEIFSLLGRRPSLEKKKMTLTEGRDIIYQMELDKLLEKFDLKKEAINAVQESGIVFIDEIDKICTSRDASQWKSDASAEGVQRDLLPLVEGTTINTKHGNVNTDYILFIASGAFHSVKPSDMLPELQGRLPIRVELQALSENDLYKILTEPVANLIRQQTELLATEGVTLRFEDDAVREIARMAALVNRTVENIGARRLHTVMERIMEPMSFDAADMEENSELVIYKSYVEERLKEITASSDLSRYVL